MARTRGASNHFPTSPSVIHADDEELVPPTTEGAPAPVSLSAVSAYHVDRNTISRDCDGADLFGLLEVILGSPLVATITPEQYATLRPDVRRHFRKVK